MKVSYKRTVEFLLEILPYALQDERFALKGGTAINLFHRNFPRFSVDIDICYLPLEDRGTSFINIHKILSEIKKSLETNLGIKVTASNPLNGKKESKLFTLKGDIGIKIEPNFILRSSLFPSERLKLAPLAIKEFEKSVEVRCLDIADCYGGKICAALDRQHPRDLFDIKFLLDNEGITSEVKDSFIFYLISHNRPINELLNPHFKDITEPFKNEFIEMANVNVALEELILYREKLIKEIHTVLTDRDKDFLLSFVSNNPNWTLVRDGKLKDYPSVKWKLLNQEKLNKPKRDLYIEKLKIIFS